MHSILVKDFMDTNPHAINENSTIREAIKLFTQASLPGAPVINDDKILVGFISEKDCIKEMLNDAFYCEESNAVSTVMSKTVQTTTPDTSILQLAESMANAHAPPKNYPVTDDGKLVGLITRKDILKALVVNNEDCYIRR